MCVGGGVILTIWWNLLSQAEKFRCLDRGQEQGQNQDWVVGGRGSLKDSWFNVSTQLRFYERLENKNMFILLRYEMQQVLISRWQHWVDNVLACLVAGSS